MNFSDKVNHIKDELKNYLNSENKLVQNSVFRNDVTVAE
jgi:hypothetical protein